MCQLAQTNSFEIKTVSDFSNSTVDEIELATLTLTLDSFVQTQPMVHCNMPLEPHCNSKFKTGAGIEKWTKNAWVMAKKLNLIWNPNRWVFWAFYKSIIYSLSNFKGQFFTQGCINVYILWYYIPIIPLGSLLTKKIWQKLKKLKFRDYWNH